MNHMQSTWPVAMHTVGGQEMAALLVAQALLGLFHHVRLFLRALCRSLHVSMEFTSRSRSFLHPASLFPSDTVQL